MNDVARGFSNSPFGCAGLGVFARTAIFYHAFASHDCAVQLLSSRS